jgi:YVTN family beta-propeller protein
MTALILATMAISGDLTSTGRTLTPVGKAVATGGFPTNLEVSPDGKWVAVTHGGTTQDLVILDAKTGRIKSRLSFEGQRPDGKAKDGLYFGLKWANDPAGSTLLFAAHGAADRVASYRVSSSGSLSGPVNTYVSPRPLIADRMPHFLSGIAVSSDGNRIFAIGNQSFALSKFEGSLSVFDHGQSKPNRVIGLPMFPLDAALVTIGAQRDKKLYVSCEGASSVAVVDTNTLQIVKRIPTGLNPTHLAFDRDQKHLFVSCASSDSVTVIDTADDSVAATILVRPAELRGLPGANPLGLSVSPDNQSLYVALSDLNAVSVVDIPSLSLRGLVPTGWYPTDVVPVTGGLMVAWGKGDRVVNPNRPPVGTNRTDMINGDSGSPIRSNLVGKVARIPWPTSTSRLDGWTRQVGHNNAFARLNAPLPARPGIDKVIYIIKENRTYDQFFGDLKIGNGDPKLHLYGDDLIPNQRALVKRFGLWDNFYACAEMSADGWSWSTAGITSEYVQRNAQYEYSGHKREYDYEGQTNGTPSDAKGMRNVNDPPGGYLWDNALKHKVDFINYGMYMAEGVPIKTPDGSNVADDNTIAMKAFEGRIDPNYRMYDLSYADSDMWEKMGRTFPKRRETYGLNAAKSRFSQWKSEYDRLVRADKVPPLMLVRFGNNHTQGTAPGFPDPGSMIADNDYAVGQLLEAVSTGPLWKRTAVVIMEDDAQGGYDHVDGHRSICFVVSPWVKGGIYHQFANTDSALRTVEWLLGLPPTNQFTATMAPMNCFDTAPRNLAPYRAILPNSESIKINDASSYRAADSIALFNPLREESAPDRELADILWGAAKGANAPQPKPRVLWVTRTRG